jgi:4-hydroxy-tetrahydrodipicolinate synthase
MMTWTMMLWSQGLYPTPNVREPILPFDHIHGEIAGALIERIIQIDSNIKLA